MKILVFGASGMIGTGVLLECLEEPGVTCVLAIGRSSCGQAHPKLREVIRSDLERFDDMGDELADCDACFYCLGISSAGVSEAAYERITVDLPMGAARVLAEVNPGMTFCYVSGAGADSTESSRIMWARLKGRAENALLQLPLEVFLFRPGYVQPRKGARSKTRLYRAFYAVAGPLYPVLEWLLPRHVTTTERIGRAMLAVAAEGSSTRILDNREINARAASGRARPVPPASGNS